ncbi:hypothetical protein HpMS70_16090 [Helicobacter pylori]
MSSIFMKLQSFIQEGLGQKALFGNKQECWEFITSRKEGWNFITSSGRTEI